MRAGLSIMLGSSWIIDGPKCNTAWAARLGTWGDNEIQSQTAAPLQTDLLYERIEKKGWPLKYVCLATTQRDAQ